MFLNEIRKIVDVLRLKNLRDDYIVNAVKEYLQLRILSYLYNNKTYSKNLIFTGGTCLRFCFNLPRLSEDLDFDYENEISVEVLRKDIENYLKETLKVREIVSVIKGKNKKIYFKFPILKELSLSFGSSDVLFLKVEPSLMPRAPMNPEISVINREGLYFLIRRYSISDLMSGKIHAFLTRSFYKGKDNEVDFKGRDVFDLIWYMGQNIKPDVERLKILLKKSLSKEYTWNMVLDEMKSRLQKIRKQHIVMDIQNFIEDQNSLFFFLDNYKKVFEQYYKEQKL